MRKTTNRDLKIFGLVLKSLLLFINHKKRGRKKFCRKKLAYPYYMYYTFIIEESNIIQVCISISFLNSLHKDKISLNMNKSLCFYNNVESLVVDKVVIFIISWELVLSYLVRLDRVLIKRNCNSYQKASQSLRFQKYTFICFSI